MAKEKKTEDKSLIIIGIISIVIIVSGLLITYAVMKDKTKDELEAFSNMFGGINSLFSGLALAGIILTVLLQKNELTLQRRELIETREELKRSAEAQEKSERAHRKQAENLKISAQLSAMSTLVNYYSDEEKRLKHIFPSPTKCTQAIEKKRDCIRKIEEILQRKELS